MRIRHGIGLAVAIVMGGCGGSDKSSGPPAGARVNLDQAAAVQDSVTVTGKTLTATSHGTTYTLEIPAGAVQVPTRITMTPVTGIDKLGVTQFIGAVDLQPQGLVLGKAARLRIAVPHSAPSGTVLLGFGFEGDADSLARQLPVDSAGGINLSIHHFSGGGAAFATFGEIQTFAPAPANLTQDDFYVDSLFELTVRDPRDFLAEQNLMRAWFAGAVLPTLQNATTDIQLLFAMSEYDFWRNTQTQANLIPDDPLFADERSQFADAALAKLKEAIFQNNVACETGRDIRFANNVLYWQTVADELGLATVANGLDREGILADLCIHVLITDSTYPDPVAAQQTASLDLLAGLKYGDNPNLDNMRFIWRLDITGSTADGTVQGPSAADGSFTHVIAPTGQGSLVVAISACLFAPEVPYADVCAHGNLVRNLSCGTVLTGVFRLQDSIDVAQFRDVREVVGRLEIVNQADLTMNFPCLVKVGELVVSSTGPGILNMNALQTVVAGTEGLSFGSLTIGNTGLRFVNLPSLQFVGRNLNIQQNNQLTTIVLSAVNVRQNLSIFLNPALTSLSLGAAQVEQQLILSSNGLTSLAGISSGVVTNQLFIQGNPGFTDQDARDFANRITVRQSSVISGNGPQ